MPVCEAGMNEGRFIFIIVVRVIFTPEGGLQNMGLWQVLVFLLETVFFGNHVYIKVYIYKHIEEEELIHCEIAEKSMQTYAVLIIPVECKFLCSSSGEIGKNLHHKGCEGYPVRRLLAIFPEGSVGKRRQVRGSWRRGPWQAGGLLPTPQLPQGRQHHLPLAHTFHREGTLPPYFPL